MKNIINFRLFVLFISITNIFPVYPAQILRWDGPNADLTISTIHSPGFYREPGTVDLCSFGLIAVIIKRETGASSCSEIFPEKINSLTSLDLSYINIDSIPEDVFRGFKSLKKLDLSGNQINSIPKNVFSTLPSLESLDLHNNNIKQISYSAFEGLNSLKSIKLGGNPITTIDRKLVGLNSAVEVEGVMVTPLTGFQNVCGRGAIGKAIAKATSSDNCNKVKISEIVELDLSKQNISEIPNGAFAGFFSLRKINLSNNNLSSISSDPFNGLDYIEEIDLSSNQLSEIPVKSLKNSLVKLSFGGNKIYNIPDNAFQNSVRLRSLNLANNLIEKINRKAFKGLDELETLTLQSNKINEISDEAFEDFYSLQVLDIRNNLIKCDRIKSGLGNAVEILD